MEKKEDQPQPRGFKGLSSLASDIGALNSGATVEESSGREGRPVGSTGRTSDGEAVPAQGIDSTGVPVMGWVVGLGLLSLMGWAGMQSSNTQGTSPSSAPSASSRAPLAEPPSTSVPEAVEEPPSNSSDSERTDPVSEAMEEVRPPVGTIHTLNVSQIRYCLAQSLRIDGADPEVDTSRKLEVDLFNEWVADYNSRCSEFRYYEGDLERAQLDIEPRRDDLLAEGRSRFLALVRRESLSDELFSGGTEATDPHNAPTATPSRTPSGTTSFSTGLSGKPDLYGLSESERQGIERACDYERRLEGAAAYYGCLANQLKRLNGFNGKPDLTALSQDEREGVERACDYERRLEGPAAYYGCIRSQLRSLSRYLGKPDLSALSEDERQGIERACDYEHRLEGPAAYYGCISSQLLSLSRYSHKPDLSVLSQGGRQGVERACDYERRLQGPAAYYGCLIIELRRLGHGGG